MRFGSETRGSRLSGLCGKLACPAAAPFAPQPLRALPLPCRFACQVGSHCAQGMLVKFTVE